MSERRPSPGALAAAVVLAVLAMAPTPGDVGGCGKSPTPLDERSFAAARKLTDCRRCSGCSLGSERCRRTCDGAIPPAVAFPGGCQPLLHDGEVCLRALQVASCARYSLYMADDRASVPSECDFCRGPEDAAPSGPLLQEAGP